MTGIRIFGVEGMPEIAAGDDLAALIAERAQLEDGDVVVVAQKIVSKAEGRVVHLDNIEPSERARELADEEHDARLQEMILQEAKRIVRTRGGLVIAETQHGFVCAAAGVDASNAPKDSLVLLPLDPDASARAVRDGLRERTGRTVGVIVTDSFGRAWRQGTTDVAIGVAGLPALVDLKGERDAAGYELRATMIAVADEIAGAAELVRGKLDGIPVAVVRGLSLAGDGSASDLVMPAERDLFR